DWISGWGFGFNQQINQQSAICNLKSEMSMELPVIQPGRPRETQPPIFEKIGIVSLGLIGGSIAQAARQLWPTSLVIAVDNKDVLETAMRMHAIDVAADDLIVLAEADIVSLARPHASVSHATPAANASTAASAGPVARALQASDPALERLFAFIRALGAEPRTMTVETHDRMLAYLSHLPQLTASALMQVVGDAVGQ